MHENETKHLKNEMNKIKKSRDQKGEHDKGGDKHEKLKSNTSID